MKISLVVASYHQFDNWDILCSRLAQDCELIGEVILVEDDLLAEPDRYRTVYQSHLPSSIPLQILERPHEKFGLSRSLNLGCRAAQHEIVLVMEGDEFFWGPTASDDFRLVKMDPSILLAGRKICVDPEKLGLVIEPDHRTGVPLDYRFIWWWCSGGHLMFWKSAWEALDGFDEVYEYGLHDFDYAARHAKLYGPESIVYGGGTMAHRGSSKGRANPSVEAWDRFGGTLIECFGPRPCLPPLR